MCVCVCVGRCPKRRLTRIHRRRIVHRSKYNIYGSCTSNQAKKVLRDTIHIYNTYYIPNKVQIYILTSCACVCGGLGTTTKDVSLVYTQYNTYIYIYMKPRCIYFFWSNFKLKFPDTRIRIRYIIIINCVVVCTRDLCTRTPFVHKCIV